MAEASIKEATEVGLIFSSEFQGDVRPGSI
jgi:hypothetical protein